MKILKKLKFIVPPKKDIHLDNEDLSILMGGDNCSTFTTCSGSTSKGTCADWNNGACTGGGTMRCTPVTL